MLPVSAILNCWMEVGAAVGESTIAKDKVFRVLPPLPLNMKDTIYADLKEYLIKANLI